jgi:hypothetical protein
MRRTTIATALICTLVVLTISASATADEKQDGALHRVVELPKLAHVPLKKVLRSIATQADLRLSYELEAIEQAQVSLETPIDANLPSIPAGEALKLILEPLGLEYAVSGETVLVSAPIARDHWQVISYPVADLLTSPGTSPPAKSDITSLVELIKSTIAAPTWQQKGSPYKINIDSDNDDLLIAQTVEVHGEIAAFLKQLRGLRLEGTPKEALRSKVNLAIHNERLSKVLDEISNQCHVNVFLTPECGNPTIDIDAHEITGQEALAKMLPPSKLRQKFRNEALLITADKRFFAVVYSVGDIVKAANSGPDFRSLVNKISEEVLPETWNQRDGGASIAAFATNLSLVVTQNEEGHEQVKAFLQKLRASN